ncbi:MAG: class I SAM-dependent methyltransferase, partial [Gammaproteobacteria bacterium]|nr:class I SAM-dependent methyltransferase [Gammaproteobacteria bacterium]
IQRYIFPGGMLPSPRALEAQARAAGLVLEPIDPQASRLPEPDYARTLSLWLRRFDAARESVHALGLADRFVRMWRFYLAYCEAGFRSGRIDVRQSVLARS